MLTKLLSPFGFDLFCLRNKFLVYNLTGKNLKLRYRQSALGIFWSLILPLVNALIYYVVFQYIMRVQVPYYLVYLISGALPWAFLSTTIMDGMESLRANAGLITKIPLPLQVFPLVSDITGLVNLVAGLPVILGAALLSGLSFHWPILLVPVILALLFLLAYGLAMILSVAVIYADDLKHAMSAVIQIWFYMTPILYDTSMVPDRFQWILYVNPVGSLFVSLRTVIIQGAWPTWQHIAASLAWTFGLLLVGMFFFRKKSKRVAEII